MRILALIPARGGSKRLPGKNIRPLGGKPLIAWSVEAARESGCLDAVLVSTDDPAIEAAALAAGARSLGLRPAELATDEAGSVEVALHALDAWESAQGPVDGLMLLQPTSPFRSVASIRRAVAEFVESGRQPQVGVSTAASHPAWCFRIAAGELQPFLPREAIAGRSQDLPPAYAVNGAMYLIGPETLRRERSFMPPGTRPLLMEDPAETLDIDTAWDWLLAEAVLAHGPLAA